MGNLNRVMLMGRLTRDPEMRYTPNGAGVVDFGLAINRTYKDQSGERKEQVTFVDITAWGRTGEVVNEYLSKGRSVFIEGRLDFSQWETPQGEKRSKLKVVAEQITFLGGGRDDAQQGGGGQPQQRRQQDAPAGDEDFNLGDVPF